MSVRHKFSVGLYSVATVFLLSSCSSGGGPSVLQSSASASSLPAAGVPKVEQPLNTDAAEKEPCSVITKEQIESLGEVIKDTVPEMDSALGSSCDWKLEGPGLISTGLSPARYTVRGLSDIYEKGLKGGFPSFIPITVSGYPAIIFDRSANSCAIVVGVRDNKIYDISADVGSDSPYKNRGCEAAQKVGEFLIAHLKGA